MSSGRIAIPRYRAFAGPRLLDRGFRPFFLGAGVWAVVALAAWLHMFAGGPPLPSHFSPLAWHVHEMMYGFIAATIAGFLLTAIPNWTGRMPLQGVPLLLLVLLWLAGRVAMATSAWIGAGAAAALDLAFLFVFLLVVLREIVAGRNWRNLAMAVALLALLAGNALMHAEASYLIEGGGAGYRLAIAVVVMLVSLVGGRIIPSFTRNWLVKRGETRLPAAFGVPDKLALATTGVALALWAVRPEGAALAGALLLAAVAQGTRLARWRGHRTLAEPLVWVLHLAYAWLPVGLTLLAMANWPGLVAPTMGVHALTAGAIATITLAVMTRATLGHTGRELHAGPWTTAIYAAVTLAAFARLAAAAMPAYMMELLAVSGAAWLMAFSTFVLVYGRILVLPTPARRGAG